MRTDSRPGSLLSPRPSSSALLGGLANRVLADWACPQRYLSSDWKCYQSIVTSELLIPAGDIVEQLPEVVKEIPNPLYEAFDFFDMPISVMREELERMRGKRD